MDYQTEYKLSLEEIRGAVEAIRALFDEQWTQNALDVDGPNVVLRVLFGGRGAWPFENLMWLGRIATAVSRIPTVAGRLRELIGPKVRSTLFELEVASWLVEMGWDVEFLKPTNDKKTPDMKVRMRDMQSWIECKRFELDQWENWASELTHEIIRQVHERGGSQLPSFDIVFESRLSDLNWNDERIRRGIIQEIAARICDEVVAVFDRPSPTSTHIPGIGEIRVRSERDRTQRGIGGLHVSPQGTMRRIVQNGILEAAQQLQEHGQGGVVLYSDITPPKELVQVVLEGLNRADESLLRSVGLVVIPGSLGAAPVIWKNPSAGQDAACEQLAVAFTNALTRIETRLLLPQVAGDE